MKTLTEKKQRYGGNNVSLEVPSRKTGRYNNPETTGLYEKKRPSFAHGASNRYHLPVQPLST